MKRYLKTIIPAAMILIIAGIAFYFWKLAPDSVTGQWSIFSNSGNFSVLEVDSSSVEASVQIFEVKSSVIEQTVFGTGTLASKTRFAVSPRKTGAIRKLYADQGDTVKAGALLVEMDSDDILQQLNLAKAELAVAQASLQRIDTEIRFAKAKHEYANLMFQRSEKLLSINAESRSTYNKNRQNMLVAAADFEQAGKRRIEAESTIAKHQAQIDYYNTQLSETRLTAPFDALIIRRNHAQGAIVNPGVSIMDIVDTSNIRALVRVDENQIACLRNGLEADVFFHTLPQQRFQGKICHLGRESDRETREYKVDIALEKLPPNWTLGQRLEVSIKVSEPKTCVNIPANLIFWEKNQPFVLCIVNGKITKRPVELGIRSQDKVEIISGLQAGEKLVMQPQKYLQYINRQIKK